MPPKTHSYLEKLCLGFYDKVHVKVANIISVSSFMALYDYEKNVCWKGEAIKCFCGLGFAECNAQ